MGTKVYLRRLVLSNVKGFSELDINLCPQFLPGREHKDSVARFAEVDNLLDDFGGRVPVNTNPFPGWTVVTGNNGSGKSTILKSIGLALMGPDKARFLQSSYDGWVTEGEESASISVEILPNSDIDKTRLGGAPYKSTFWAEVDIERDAESPGGSPWEMKSGDHLGKKKKGAQSGPWQLATAGWLAIGYGPFRRMYGSSSAAAALEADPQKARFATLFLEDATLIKAEEWLQELDYQSARGGNPQVQQSAANRLAIIQKVLSADFLKNGMKFETVNASGVWLYDSDQRMLRLRDMSEGYRAALAMLIDILRHIFLAYDNIEDMVVETDEGDVAILAPAVVLIDEVDAHLHPEWQREIGLWLTSHFPLVQFIVTTHSPLVAQAATGGRVFVLPAPDEDGPARSVTPKEYEDIMRGGASDILASPAFGLSHTRSIRFVRAMKRHADLRQLSLFEIGEVDANQFEQLELFFEGRLTESL